MSFFNLRRGGQSSKTTVSQSAPAESLEIVRKRAKHRLIGSAVLVLLGVIGFPLLFDTQPRPVSVGIPIEIPSKQGVKPLSLPAPVEAPSAAASANPAPTAAAANPVTAGAAEASAAPTSVAKDSVEATAAPVVAAAATPAAKAVEKSNEKSAEKASDKASDKVSDKASALPAKSADEAARAKALLEGTGSAVAKVSASASSPASASAGETRLVVQVGAFADVAKAREARLKLERAGLKTYTQVAETKDGKRIRVRVGPYATKAEADKAAKQIKALDLPAAVLTL